MPVTYNSQAIIPAPPMSIRKEYQTTEDGTIIGSVFVIEIHGKIAFNKGSPNSQGVFWNQSGYPPDEVIGGDSVLTAIIRKQEGLRQLFAVEGQTFQVQGYDGAAPLKCNPRIRSPITFDAGQWIITCDYSVTLEADIIYVNGQALGEDTGDVTNYKISKAVSEWHIESADESNRTFRLTHNVSAVGKRFYNDAGSLVKAAWQNAQDYVLNKLQLGLDTNMMIASGVLNNNTFQAYNYLRNQTASELGGSFQVNETWLCFDPGSGAPGFEEFTINAHTGEDQRTKVVIDGSIKGLEQKDSNYNITVTKLQNATNQWNNIKPNILSRVQTQTGLTVRPTPITYQVGINEYNGIITYNYEFDDRPNFLAPNAFYENVEVEDDNPVDVFASVQVLGPALGPVLQDIQTLTARRRTVQIDVQLPAQRLNPAPGGFIPSNPRGYYFGLINFNTPIGSVVFLDGDKERWNQYLGKYSRTLSYTWES